MRLEIQRAYRTRFSLEITPRHRPPPAPELELRSDGLAIIVLEAATSSLQSHDELDGGTLHEYGVDTIAERAVAENPTLWSGPLIVLTSARTSSVAEYLAFLLQPAGRARVAGEPTRGLLFTGALGFELPGGSSLYITVALEHALARLR